ncbi:Glutamine amidotransferase [Planctomycetales bacterium 10988]|nr:Glutamine amidotransferase [Planctomycetales bacterium 10988]
MTDKRFRALLLQVRNPEDKIRAQEIKGFSSVLNIDPDHLTICDLLQRAPSPEMLKQHQMVLIGGSGDYSAAGEGSWLNRTFDFLRELCDSGKPTFGSCWGFQAIARALGGKVINDPQHAELGSVPLFRTELGKEDPLFKDLEDPFWGQAGHEDSVVELPDEAEWLAYSERVSYQAFRLKDRLIYATQFHPELSVEDFQGRVIAYPKYVEQIAQMPADDFLRMIRPTPAARGLLRKFRDLVLQ